MILIRCQHRCAIHCTTTVFPIHGVSNHECACSFARHDLGSLRKPQVARSIRVARLHSFKWLRKVRRYLIFRIAVCTGTNDSCRFRLGGLPVVVLGERNSLGLELRGNWRRTVMARRMFSDENNLRKRILRILRKNKISDLDELILQCTSHTWTQVCSSKLTT